MRAALVLGLLLLTSALHAEPNCSVLQLKADGSLACADNPHKMRDQVLANSLMALGAVCDCLTSVKGYQLGFTEANPFMRPFVKSYKRCFAAKAAIAIPVAYLGWKHDTVKYQIALHSIWGGFAVVNSIRF